MSNKRITTSEASSTRKRPIGITSETSFKRQFNSRGPNNAESMNESLGPQRYIDTEAPERSRQPGPLVSLR